MSSHPRVRSIAALAIASVVLLAGCSTTSGGGTPSSSSAASDSVQAEMQQKMEELSQPITEWPQSPAIANPADMTGKKVMIISLAEAVPILSAYSALVVDVLGEIGAEGTICDGKFDPTVVASCMQQAQSQGYDAVIATAVPYGMAPTSYAALADAGLKVLIAIDQPVEGETYPENVGFFSYADRFELLSHSEAEAAYAAEGKDANLLWLTLSATADQVVQANALEERFQELCADCGYERVEFSSANTDQIASLVSSALVKNPDTNIVILPNDSYVPLAMQGIQSAGFNGKVQVMSNAGELAGLQRVAAGQQSNDFGGPVEYDSYSLVNALIQLESGEEVTQLLPVTRNFTQEVASGLELTAENYFTSAWFGDDSFKDDFLKLWGVK